MKAILKCQIDLVALLLRDATQSAVMRQYVIRLSICNI